MCDASPPGVGQPGPGPPQRPAILTDPDQPDSKCLKCVFLGNLNV